MQETRVHPWVGKMPWRRERLPTPVLRPGELHALYSPRGHKESDATECLTFQFLSKQLRATDKVLEILLCRRGVFLRNWARDERDERNPFLFPSSWLSSRLPLTPLLGGAWGQQKSASDSPGSTLCTPPPLDRWSGNKVLLPKRLVNTEELLGEF